MNYRARRQALRKLLAEQKLDYLLVTNFVNVTYLTGFTGDDSYLLFHPGGELVLSDPRYTTQLEEECPGLERSIRPPGKRIHEWTIRVLRQLGIARLGVEADAMTLGLKGQLAEKLRRLEFAPTSGLVEQLRQVKEPDEVEEIRQSIWVAEKAFAAVRATLRPDMTEKDLADELEYRIRQFGGRCSGFPTLVGVGARAALPHVMPGQVRIRDAALVLFDWGAKRGLYHSDLTRVLVTGRIPPKLKDIYRVVYEAQSRAIEAIRPGVTCEAVDAVARNHIRKAGFGRRFGHGLGHGIGLEIHEAPRFARKSLTELKAGMVVTVEPGIYLPGKLGVRIEDDVLVTPRGHQVLSTLPKRWDEMLVD